MTISLFGPGNTAFHRAGVAGLWMTLKALEAENRGKAALDGGSWVRHRTSVTLRWTGDARKFFNGLIRSSFKLDKSRLIWFPALGAPMSRPQHAVVLQEAILNSILQHGKTRKADKAAEPGGSISVDIDGVSVPLIFHRVSHYAHQELDFLPAGPNVLAGWYCPGGVVRHSGLGSATALEEPPERALALRYAVIGAVFFEIRSRGGGIRPHYALVLPEIVDLEKYASVRNAFVSYGVQKLYAAGTADAGYRVLAELEAANLLSDVESASCRVISFGVVPWSKQQKTRVDLMTVRAVSRAALRTFNLCRHVLSPRLVKREGKEPFWDVPQVPDLVARNLSEGHEWWRGFADFIADQDRREHVLRYEKGGIAEMVEDKSAFPEGPERTFVLACHEAWWRRMGQIGEKARREGSSFGDQISREFERLRVAFSRCKNAASLRGAVTDFWARGGGPLAALQDRWHDVLGLMDDRNWRKGKDLVLLALASYKPRTKEEKRALELPQTPKEEGVK
jgi:CRISPR-associated protein Cas8a1/Csx13